jgi:uncharacterized protein (DUF58 family)
MKRPDASFFDRIASLRIDADRLGASMFAGRHATVLRGTSVVFADHREYRPGDDPRTLDIRAYARTDRPVVRRFEHEGQVVGMVVLDASGSMDYASSPDLPTKHAHAATLLSGLAFLLARHGDRVGALRIDDALRDELAPSARMDSLDRLVDALAVDVTQGRATKLAEALEATRLRLPRRALVFIATDALDYEPLERTLEHLRADGHYVTLLQVVDPAELELPFDGGSVFIGLEGDGEIIADADALRERYVEAARAWVERVRTQCHLEGVTHVLARTDDPPEHVLATLLGGA